MPLNENRFSKFHVYEFFALYNVYERESTFQLSIFCPRKILNNMYELIIELIQISAIYGDCPLYLFRCQFKKKKSGILTGRAC